MRFYAPPNELDKRPIDRDTVKRVIGTFRPYKGKVWIVGIFIAITSALGLPDDALELTWRSLSEVGNLSSATVIHVLRDTIAKRPPKDSPGLLMAMGPGFSSELVLLRWH